MNYLGYIYIKFWVLIGGVFFLMALPFSVIQASCHDGCDSQRCSDLHFSNETHAFAEKALGWTCAPVAVAIIALVPAVGSSDGSKKLKCKCCGSQHITT